MTPRRQPGRAISARPAPRLPLPAIRKRIWEQACDLVAAGDTRDLARVLANRFSTGVDVIDIVLVLEGSRFQRGAAALKTGVLNALALAREAEDAADETTLSA